MECTSAEICGSILEADSLMLENLERIADSYWDTIGCTTVAGALDCRACGSEGTSTEGLPDPMIFSMVFTAASSLLTNPARLSAIYICV